MDGEATEPEPVSTIRIEFENEDVSKMNVIEIMPVSLKQEPPYDNIHETVVKVEKVEPVVKEVVILDTQVKEETSSDIPVKEEISLDDAGEGFSGMKTEELMIKSESEYDSDSRKQGDLNKKSKNQCPCKQGVFRTKSVNDLETHRSMHTTNYESDLRMFNCDFCSFGTQDKSLFENHMPAPHDKSLKCGCAYGTASKGVKYHMLEQFKNITRKPTPYICYLCDFKTYYKSSLTTHILSRHDNNSIKKHNCDRCDYKTHHKSHLTRHITTKHGKKSANIYTKGI